MAQSLPFEPTSVRTAPNGMIALWSQPPLVYSRVRGHFNRDHAQQLIKQVDDLFAKRIVSVEQFHDWGDMSGYDLACQSDLTMWTLKVRRQVRRLTILVNSPMVKMGVRVANGALHGMIHVCENREEFEQLLNQRIVELKAS